MEIAEKSREQIASEFVMPEPEIGTPVFFYSFHNKQHPKLGFVTKLGRTGKNIQVVTFDRHVHDSVKHVDDPRLDWNNDHRESGSWDYTDEWKRLEAERENMKAQIAALEHTATKTVVKRSSRAKKTEE